MAIHHSPEYSKAVIYKTKDFKGYVGPAYRTFNLDNAKIAIKNERDMILKLSEGNKIPKPKWLVLGDFLFKSLFEAVMGLFLTLELVLISLFTRHIDYSQYEWIFEYLILLGLLLDSKPLNKHFSYFCFFFSTPINI